jgi:Ca2+/Na+ antiporter
MKIGLKTSLWEYAEADTMKFMMNRYAWRLMIVMVVDLIIMIQLKHWIGMAFNGFGFLFTLFVILSYRKYKKSKTKEEKKNDE